MRRSVRGRHNLHRIDVQCAFSGSTFLSIGGCGLFAECDGEGASLSFSVALNSDVPAVQLCEVLSHGESDARTAVAVISLIETVEHASDFLWCHASSRVSDAQCEPSCLLFECGGDFDADSPTLRCEFKGVPEQVEENTFHLFFIKPEFLRRVGAAFGVYS